MNRRKPQSESQESDRSEDSLEECQGKRITINEARNRMHQIREESERSQEESEGYESDEGVSESASAGKSESKQSQSESSSHPSTESEDEESEGKVDEIEYRIQKLQRDLEHKISQSRKEAISQVRATSNPKLPPKSELKVDSKVDYKERLEPKMDHRQNKQQKLEQKYEFKHEMKSEPIKQLRKTLTSDKQNIAPSNQSDSNLKKKVTSQKTISNLSLTMNIKKKVQETKPKALKIDKRPSTVVYSAANRPPSSSSRQPPKSSESRIHSNSLTRERTDIAKLKNALSASESLKLEQQLQLLKIVESIRTKLKRSINKKMKISEKRPQSVKNI